MNFISDLIQLLIARPDFWPLAFWVPLFLGLWLLVRVNERYNGVALAKWGWLAIGMLTLATFGWFWVVQLRSPVYLGPIQPQIAEVSWYFAEGKPIYNGSGAGEVYNMLYGPNLYIITGWFEKFFRPSDFSFKLPGALAVVTALIILTGQVWKRAGLKLALFGAGIYCGLILAMNPEELFSRSDVFIVLCVVIGCVAARPQLKFAPVILGAAFGVAVNLKITSAAYFIPLAGLAWQNGYGKKDWLAGVTAAGCMAAAPFLLFSNVSLANYLQTLQVAGSQGINPLNFFNMLEVFFSLGIPVLAMVVLAYQQNSSATKAGLLAQRRFALLLLAASIILLVPASKYGAGPHHLWPLTVLTIVLGAELYAAGVRPKWDGTCASCAVGAVLFSWLASCLGIGLVRSYQNAAYLQGRTAWAQSVEADLGQISAQYGAQHVLLMGASDDANYEYAYFRPQLVYAGQPIGIDPCALMEREFPGGPGPDLSQLQSTLARSHPHKGIIWLVPKGGEVFSITSYFARWKNNGYLPNPPAYPDKFRATFLASCTKIASSRYYDLYADQPPPVQPVRPISI